MPAVSFKDRGLSGGYPRDAQSVATEEVHGSCSWTLRVARRLGSRWILLPQVDLRGCARVWAQEAFEHLFR